MTEYIQVTPTSEALSARGIPRTIESLHKLTASSDPSLIERLNPLHGSPPLRFEFLAISEGADEPVEFYYGADEHLDTLKQRLQTIYPSTFDIERVDLDVGSRLLHPIELSREEFVDYYEADNLRYEFGPDERSELDTEAINAPEQAGEPPATNGGPTEAERPEHHIAAGDSVLELAPPDALPPRDWPARIEKPTLTEEGTILARPAVDAVEPQGVRWCGAAERRDDWMTTLTPFNEPEIDGSISPVDQPGDTLASLIDHLTEAQAPVAFQAVFERHADWESDAGVRKENLADGRDTLFQKFFGPLLESGDADADRETSISTVAERRIDAIDATNPSRSFRVNVRAVGVSAADSPEADALDKRMESLKPVFDPIDGSFYWLTPKRLRDSGFRQTTKRKRARATLRRLLNREITTGRGRTRPDLVLSGRELANFVVIPSSEQLTVEGVRGTRAEQQTRDPLPAPHPDILRQFDDGMAIGYPVDETGAPHQSPVCVPPEQLTHHFVRFASTGSGKSIGTINDALSLRASTGGPVVIVDRKGDGMCDNYLRCHYKRFGTLDDVVHFRIPETLPAFSFFDIRPALAEGRLRENAVQDKVEHFREILRMIMGDEQYEQAFVANEITGYLIKALFDKDYGNDVFGLDDLFDAALEMQRERTVPPVSADNQHVEQSLTRHFEKDDRQFQTTMDAVANRLDKLREDAQLRRIFRHAPDETADGESATPLFDFRTLLDDDVTILFDLGDLRPEAQRAITLLLLSNLWDAVQVRTRNGWSDYENLTNLIIEEAAPIAASDLVANELLPQGRSFGLSLGLVMQFPEQLKNAREEDEDDAYDEVLTNIHTKLIGNIKPDSELLQALAHEDLSPTELRDRLNTLPPGEWIAQVSDPSFGETGPLPFSLTPLPITPGHPESEKPLTDAEEEAFESEARPRMIEGTKAQYGLGDPPDSSTSQDGGGWGSTGAERAHSGSDAGSASKQTESAFIKQPPGEQDTTSHDSSPSDSSENAQASSPLLGGSMESGADATADPAEEAATDSAPIQESAVPVPDEELRERGLSRDDVRFLRRVLDVMHREASEYTLMDSMRPLRDEFDDLNLQRLLDQDLVEDHSACGRMYYTVLPAGRELLGTQLRVGPGQGDIGEKTPHKVGVRLLELWLQGREDVARVEPYYQHADDTVFDVAGFDASGDLVYIGEAELPSNNAQAVVDDYDKLSAVDADAVWAVKDRDTALEVLDRLADADRIEASVSGRDARSFSTIRDAVQDFDAAGMTTLRGFKNLDREVSE